MVVITRAGFVQSGGPGRFELAQQVYVSEVCEDDVHRLYGNGGELLPYSGDNFFRIGVRM